jgi:hypothetical protein
MNKFEVQKCELSEDGKFLRMWPKPSLGYVEIQRDEIEWLAKFMDGNFQCVNWPAVVPTAKQTGV